MLWDSQVAQLLSYWHWFCDKAALGGSVHTPLNDLLQGGPDLLWLFSLYTGVYTSALRWKIGHRLSGPIPNTCRSGQLVSLRVCVRACLRACVRVFAHVFGNKGCTLFSKGRWVPVSPPCIISAVSYGRQGWQRVAACQDGLWHLDKQASIFIRAASVCFLSCRNGEPSLRLYIVFCLWDKCSGPLRGKNICTSLPSYVG